MPVNISSIRAQLFKKLEDKEYRDAFMSSHLATNIAAQISSTREHRGWKQDELAERAGMAQSRISLIEDPSYDTFTLKTLKRLASAFDVALIVRFVSYSELVDWVVGLSPSDLTVSDFSSDSLSAELGTAGLARSLLQGNVPVRSVRSSISDIPYKSDFNRPIPLSERYEPLPGPGMRMDLRPLVQAENVN